MIAFSTIVKSRGAMPCVPTNRVVNLRSLQVNKLHSDTQLFLRYEGI